MTVRFSFPGDTPPASAQRGAAPVGVLHELPPVELAAIVYLRAWCEGGQDRAMIAKDFRLVMGDAAAADVIEDFDLLMTTLLGGARRPVMRHAMGCKCFGGDESAFANLIAAAAGRDSEDALLFAGTLASSRYAWDVVQVALRLGQVFLRLARLPLGPDAPTHNPEQTFYKH